MKFNPAKRAFLKRAPVAVAAAGIGVGQIANAAAGSEAMQLAAVKTAGETMGGIAGGGLASSGGGSANAIKLLTILKTVGLPAWKRAEMRQWAKNSRVLDPDIASMRSLSLDAKLRMQWKRNYETLEKSIFDQLTSGLSREAFGKQHGVDQWW